MHSPWSSGVWRSLHISIAISGALARQVVDSLRGTSASLEAAFDNAYAMRPSGTGVGRQTKEH
jgi:hypothetical protein